MPQKGAYSKDLFFVEQLLTGLVAANAIKDIQALSQASGMFKTVHRHLLRAGTLPPDVKPSLHMPTLVGLEPLQVRFCLFCMPLKVLMVCECISCLTNLFRPRTRSLS